LLALVFSARLEAGDAAHGKLVYELWCATCHARIPPGGAPIAGTSALERLYKGAKPAALEDRSDLSVALLKTLIRSGRKSMPPSRKTEVSDADINDIAAYLVRSP
jgi:mono/diheme cytochrome c family protein